MVEVRDEGAVAPGVERVAVAGDVAGEAVAYRPANPAAAAALEICSRRRVSRISSARPPDEVMIPRRRPAGRRVALAGRQHFGEFGEIARPRSRGGHAACRRRRRCRRPRRRCASRRHVRATRGAADLQRHDRLVPGGGAIERGGEALRRTHGFDEAADHRGVRIIDQVFEEIAGIQHRFVAARDDMAEAEAADIGQQADAQPAALRHDADIAGEPVRVADLLQIGRVALDRVQDAHAVGTAQRDAALAADRGDAVLQPAPSSPRSAKPPS